MTPHADWSPLSDHIALASAGDHFRFIAGAALGLACGMGAAGMWLEIDPLAGLVGTMLLLFAPITIVGFLAPARWSNSRREALAAATAIPASLGAWVQAARYFGDNLPELWVWAASFVLIVIILGAFETIVATEFTRIIAGD
ncbi:MAG: hypothetical protein LC118_16715 [Dehalococcoidia bacterium]|nr:hypothetical protein [Dehalococcoidia bacterium]